MLAKVISAAVVGLDAVPITVEVDVASKGLPSFTKVGPSCQQQFPLNSKYPFKKKQVQIRLQLKSRNLISLILFYTV